MFTLDAVEDAFPHTKPNAFYTSRPSLLLGGHPLRAMFTLYWTKPTAY